MGLVSSNEMQLRERNPASDIGPLTKYMTKFSKEKIGFDPNISAIAFLCMLVRHGQFYNNS